MNSSTPYPFEEQQSLAKAKEQFLDKWLKKDESWIHNIEFTSSKRNLKIHEVVNLGLSYFNNELCASYYIGIDWIKNKDSEQKDYTKYLVVYPKKNDNLDYVGMLVHCLKHQEISPFLKEIYHFDFKKPEIPITDFDCELTPFMIVHFLSLVEKITKQGLKKNYIVVEENLQSKIKGKIVFSQQLKKNIAAKREDRVYCRFQEYSVNCFENRLLKKAMTIIKRYSAHHLKHYKELIQKENRILSFFENISEEISISEIKRVKVNALYKEYVEAIDLAKTILQRFAYSYKKADDKTLDKELPPFWIDMSKLFELYVYSLLRETYGATILYQLSDDGKRQTHGKYGDVDFLKTDEKLIIDTKYKPKYDEDYKIEDIRQLSGYARDEGVLKKLKLFKPNTQNVDDEKVVDCVIIYPIVDDKKDNKKDNKTDFNNRNIKEAKINGFTKFYKCGIKLPAIKTN
ncbi:hypothetical protein FACS189430_02230 [Bacteroidia bacterium]|nr:hypothetical protein FACS189430_02230 [Bacteroidia bacterium]